MNNLSCHEAPGALLRDNLTRLTPCARADQAGVGAWRRPKSKTSISNFIVSPLSSASGWVGGHPFVLALALQRQVTAGARNFRWASIKTPSSIVGGKIIDKLKTPERYPSDVVRQTGLAPICSLESFVARSQGSRLKFLIPTDWRLCLSSLIVSTE